MENQIKPGHDRMDFEESWIEQCRENEATLSELQSRMQEALAAKGCVARSAASYETKQFSAGNLEAPDKALQKSPLEIEAFQSMELIDVTANS